MSTHRAVSRRDLLRGQLRGLLGGGQSRSSAGSHADSCAAAARVPDEPRMVAKQLGRVMSLPIHRPPGAVPEAKFLELCTRCNACAEACPAASIVAAPSRFRQAAETPMIDPYAAACIMCDDAPCIRACEPGALRDDAPRKMGVAWIQPEACLAHVGSFCSVCVEQCPVNNAISVAAGRPSISPELCTGCGVCAAVCPAPERAVVILPLADRAAT